MPSQSSQSRVPEAIGVTHLAAVANGALSIFVEPELEARGYHAHDALKDVYEAR
ncbi:MAG: hypothetical protein JOZ19_02600 [Rubrobacter sp.]|nr:hypothetical protein [Rubrobacter sp.]